VGLENLTFNTGFRFPESNLATTPTC
jgi:hypothetical protein